MLLFSLMTIAFVVSVIAAPASVPSTDDAQVESLEAELGALWTSERWTYSGTSTGASVIVITTTVTTTEVQTSDSTSSTATSSTASVSSSSSSSTSTSSAPTQTLTPDEQEFMDLHNAARMDYGAANLTWSDDLAAVAQEWADGCVFEHSDGILGPYGENLAAGTGNFTIPACIGLWVEEASEYDPANPAASHFTQVVWKSTTQVGCAVASCGNIFPETYGNASYYVCEYSPAGNIIGQFPENVES